MTPRAVGVAGHEEGQDTMHKTANMAVQYRPHERSRGHPGTRQPAGIHRACSGEPAPGAYIVTAPAGVITHISPAVEALFGSDPGSLIGELVLAYIADDRRRAFAAQLMQVQQMSRSMDWTIQFQPRARAAINVTVAITPLRDHLGQIAGWEWRFHHVSSTAE